MKIEFKPIGFVHTDANHIPRHWSVSDVEGTLNVDKKYTEGLKDIKKGQKIVVIFTFHNSPDFTETHLKQKPPNRKEKLGVFSICSPVRPNAVGMSVLEVKKIEKNVIYVKGLDMIEGTPLLDIKPYIEKKHACPSYRIPDK